MVISVKQVPELIVIKIYRLPLKVVCYFEKIIRQFYGVDALKELDGQKFLTFLVALGKRPGFWGNILSHSNTNSI